MKKADIKFTVEGRGDFPLDMLRYDRCFPRTGMDCDTITYTGEVRQVTLVALNRVNRFWAPTEGRWLSFGWSVVEVAVIE